MKKTFIIALLCTFVYGLCTNVAGPLVKRAANEVSTDRHPTKEEWLEVYLTHRIRQTTDVCQQRIAVIIRISTKEQEIVVGLTSANGQQEISQSAKNAYVRHVEAIVKPILEEYSWVRNYKLTVTYV